MENKLKVGQRIEVYESLPSKHLNLPFPAGMQRCLIEKMEGMFVFNCFFSWGETYRQYMGENEVKKVGTFIVREVYTNRDAETII